MDPNFEDAGVGCVRRRFCGEGSMTQDSGMCNLGHLGMQMHKNDRVASFHY